MFIAGECKQCAAPDVGAKTYHIYDKANTLVGKLHLWVLSNDGQYQAKVIAKDKTWLDFEAQEIQKDRPDLFAAFYGGHPGVRIDNSGFLATQQQAEQQLEAKLASAKAWIEAKCGGCIEFL